MLNDFFDADIDSVERPERPIPSGVANRNSVAFFGGSLLLAGILLAFLTHWISGCIALGVAILVIIYDASAKAHPVLGPLTMGLCRGGNLILGISIIPAHVLSLGFLSIIPVIYIVAVTMVSRGEVHGSNKVTLNLALGLYILTFVMVASLGVLDSFVLVESLLILILLSVWVLPPLFRARASNNPALIGKAVKFGVWG